MPTSPSENRTKWRKRKREPQISRRQPKHEDEDDEEEDPNGDDDHLERQDDSEDQTQHPNPQSGSNSQAQLEIEVLSDDGVQISQFPRVIKRTVNRPHASVTAIVALERANESGDNKGQLQNSPFLENLSYGQLQTLSTVPADSSALDQDRNEGSNSAYVITPPPLLEGRGIVKRFGSRVLVVPMHSEWFSPATVHRLERQVVPRFFSGKSPDHTPEKYMECRNYIVARYMEDLGKRITIFDCHGLLVGVDNEDLTRIFRFLDHWGIINYCALVPSHEPWNDKSYLKDEASGEIRVPSDALKSIDGLIKFDKPKCKLKAEEIYLSLTTQNADISDLEDRIREHLSENHCNYCSRPLPAVYYQSQKEADVLLCTDCFHDGGFVVGHSSIDFIRVDSTRDYSDLDGDSWTDQETLLLLEAMEIYHENWNEIAEHVGTKSKAQCILHFLRLPMEDGKLENINVPRMSLSSNMSNTDDCGRLRSNLGAELAGPTQSIDPNSRLPFSNSENPVMALVAFLASAIGPRVAAACAHAALAELSGNNSGSAPQAEAPGHSNRMNLESKLSKDGGPLGEIANPNQQDEDEAKALGSQGPNEGEAIPLSSEKVKDAAKAGLSAAAMKAKLFADHEEREIQRLCANIINHQLKRLELKLKQFAEIETLLMKECDQMEKARQRFAAERSRLVSAWLGSGVATNTSGVGPSTVSNNNGNSRQQMAFGSPSQPSVSAYTSGQAVHPHMSFVPRPSVFGGLGQRLPLSMIQQSQSTSPNPMFKAPGNVQPSTNHPLLRPVSGTNSGLG
ncbi:SWI/SNF complex subunit SWI3C isoform X1 [Prosopis cineraria]|uniref:SWI/SNF complex subunit SWI3C isoform X1 n=1 Tax=Prosopis cineraria TaxID=364024 RepID=UPI002410A9C6|nr:SWI/SNF complex subunit SWI3C isoform X1 [Prosopis cineraria]